MTLTLSSRLIWVQFIKGEELRQKAFENRFRNIEVKAKRGVIYDAKGRPLAISVSTDSFYAIPVQVRNSKKEDEIADNIASVLELDKEKVKTLITKRQAFVWIKRHVPADKARLLKDMKLPGINYVEEPQRFYPKGKLMAHLLGFAGIDNQGLNGIEITYNKVLSGKPGTIMVEYDNKGLEIPGALQKYIPPEDGNSIVLTIDETIQYIVERELDEVMKLKNPKRAGVIVMEPKTGHILAMAARPAYDPNKYQEYDTKLWRNFMISDVYEPGSTFKTVTAAGAMEEGVVKSGDRFYCPGYVMVGKERIKCWKFPRAHGSESFEDGVRNSCNPVFVAIALREGKDIFYRYLYGFGFGKKTGIELPGEALGILVNKERAKDIDLASMSIGQANAVTPIQLLTAFAAISNGGYRVKPQLVKEIIDKDGNLVKKIETEVIQQVISKDTSTQLLNLLETVVSEGTGSKAYVEGYRVGGKTGTAQKIIPGGGYSNSEYIASFMGVAPVNDPKLVALVVIDSPEGVYYGGQVAAPVFKNIVRDTLRYLQVPAYVDPEKIEQNKTNKVAVPDVKSMEINKAIEVLKRSNLKVEKIGSGTNVKVQLPLAGSEIHEGAKVILYTSIPAQNGNPESIVVPDLTGKSIIEVRDLIRLFNLNFEIIGSGEVVRQEPIPGTQINVGSTIKIYMETVSNASVELVGP